MEYNLIVAEKPKAAEKIAKALSNGNLKVFNYKGVKVYEFGNYRVVAALGHLFKLDTNDKKWYYPVFDCYWKPITSERSGILKYINALKEIGKNAKEIIIATDYDVEGSVIGYNVLRFIFNRQNAKRMKFSSLTKQEIVKAFNNSINSLDFGQVYAGLTRHYLDFYWGINLTRALTIIANLNKVISCGRVQTPTLNLILERENEIRNFVPQNFWIIKALLQKENENFFAEYIEGRIFERERAIKIYEDCNKAKAVKVLSIDKKKVVIKPLPPFNLTSLQTESYRLYKFSPSKTLKIAEELYLNGYITYPRTSSEKMPIGISFRKILESLCLVKNYEKFCTILLGKEKLIPREGEKDDPAHPAIVPTGEIPRKLSKDEEKIYDLIVRRFINCFYDDLIVSEQKIYFDINGYKFVSVGKTIEREGWLKVYPKKVEERTLPRIELNDKIFLLKINLIQDVTKPPKRYNLSELIKLMEAKKLGTKTTRSEIIETLFRRNFIEGKKTIKITKFGEKLIEILKKHVEIITSVDMTRKFEEKMEEIQIGKERMENVLEEAKKTIIEILDQIDKNKNEIRKSFIEALTH